MHVDATCPLPKEYFQFAGRLIGKLLFQSAVSTPQCLPVRLSRSMLAQVLGLQVGLRYMEADIPEDYETKIKGILDTSMANLDLDMAFTDDVVEPGKQPRQVELKKGGARIAVTDENKHEYVALLAEYRLRGRCREQMDAFALGLTELIPDELLGALDESDLDVRHVPCVPSHTHCSC